MEDKEYYDLVQICLRWRHSPNAVNSNFTETDECQYKRWKIIRHNWNRKDSRITYVGLVNNYLDIFKKLRESDPKTSYYYFMQKNRIEASNLNDVLQFIDNA